MLETLVLPKSLKTIGPYALQNAGMTSVTFGSSPTIGSYAFSGCKNLKSVVIDNDVEKYAFQNCTALESVTIKGGCSSIGYAAVTDCTSL